ncbi:MAG: hypothetical protein AAF623_14460, partial [Planctomycetota bacterium]
AFGLPYQKPPKPDSGKKGKTKEEQQKIKRQLEMIALLSSPPGKIRYPKVNQKFARWVSANWIQDTQPAEGKVLHLKDAVYRSGEEIGEQEIWLGSNGEFRIHWLVNGEQEKYFHWDGQNFYLILDGNKQQLTLQEAKQTLPIIQGLGILAHQDPNPLAVMGSLMIDGSGKSQQKNAWRMSYHDSGTGPFYCWLQMYSNDGPPQPKLLKLSSTLDGTESGAVLFSDWQLVDSIEFPSERKFVEGLAETTELRIVNRQAQWIKEPDDWFSSSAEPAETSPREIPSTEISSTENPSNEPFSAAK